MTRRPTRPCPAFGVPCELAVMADVSVAQAAEIERLRAALAKLATGYHGGAVAQQIARAALAQPAEGEK